MNCVLNLGLQAVGLMRSKMSDVCEQSMNQCSSMKDIRAAAVNNANLEEALGDSLESVKLLLSSIFQRLKLKDCPFQVFQGASKHEMDAFWSVVTDIDTNIQPNMGSKKHLVDYPKVSEFIEHCCRARQYSFCIKKCGNDDCTICRPPRLSPEVFQTLSFLPDPVPLDQDPSHYKQFDDVYGTLTTEKHRPSLINSKSKEVMECRLVPVDKLPQTLAS